MLNLKALTLAVVMGVLSPVVPINVLNMPQVLAQTQEEQADQLLRQGIQQGNAGRFQEAIQSFMKALKIYREIGDRNRQEACLFYIAQSYQNLKQYRAAIEMYQQSLQIAQENGNLKGEAVSSDRLGRLYATLKNYQNAIQYFQQSLEAAQKLDDSKLKETAQNNLERAQREQRVSQNQNNPQKVEADRLFEQGIEEFRISQFQEALQSFQEALKIYQKIGDRAKEAHSLNNLGNVYHTLGEYQQAIEFFQKSLAIRQEIGIPKGEADSLGSLGNVYKSLGQYQKAIELYQQSLIIQQEIGDRKGEAASLHNLGDTYQNLGQYQRAIEYHQQSLTIDKEIGDHNGKAIYLRGLGSVYSDLGQYRRAFEYYQQSLTTEKETGNRRGEASSLNSLGNVYRIIGQYRRAIEYYQQSLTINKEIGGRNGEGYSLVGLGSAYYDLEQYQKAIEYYQQSLVIGQELGLQQLEAASLSNLGLIYGILEQYDKAVKFLQQSLAITRELDIPMGEAYSRNSLGTALLITGKPIEAEVEFRKAINIFESFRIQLEQDRDKVSIFDRYFRPFRFLQVALIAQNKMDAALEVSEKGRARSLAESISQRLNNDRQGLISTTESLNINQIRQIAKDKNTTLVQYSIVRFQYLDISSLYIWVVKPTGEVTFKEVDLSSVDTPLNQLVNNSRIEDIGARGRNLPDGDIVEVPSEEFMQDQQAEQTANLRQLHDLLIQPIADLLPTDPSEKVVFMPQGELYLVPFPALMDEQNQYLIEKHTILTAPSIQLLDIARKSHTEKRNNSATDVLIVGNPTMPEVWNPNSGKMIQLSSLTGAEDEAFAIANKLQTKPLVWDEATEPIVTQKMQNARLIHLATHGLLEYGIPEESGVLDAPGAIALAPAGDADGLLTSAEIYNMNLQAELVVLSACDTGRGKISGDGVIGLSRAFLQAGVPSLIVSLWKVPDDSTQFLMTKFYDYWQGDMDKVTALRQAILDTKEKYPQPINWAAFTLVGEAQ